MPVQDPCKTGKDDWEALRASSEAFSVASPVADTLAIAVGITYAIAPGRDKVLSVLIREIRRLDKNTCLFRAEHGVSGQTELLSSHGIKEIFAGPFGRLYVDDTIRYDENPLRDKLHETGKKLLRSIGVKILDFRKTAPGITEFFKFFELFENKNFYLLRLKIHLLKHLIKTAGNRKQDTEAYMIRRLIESDKTVLAQDVEKLMEYADYSLITPETLKNTVEQIQKIPGADLTSIIFTAKSIIEADGAATQREQKLYNLLLEAAA